MIDRDSDTWREVAAFIESEHDRALAALRSPALDFPNTQFVRGQLQAFHAVLDCPHTQQQPPIIHAEDLYQ